MNSSNLPQLPKTHDGVVPKVLGADVELANFFVDENSPTRQTADLTQSTAGDAARLLLAQIDGCPSGSTGIYQGGYAYSYGYTGTYYGRYDSDWRESGDTASDYPSYREHAQDRGRKFLASNGSSIYIDMDHLEFCPGEVLSAYEHVAAWHAMTRIARDAMHKANAQMPPGKKVKLLATNTGGQDRSWGSHMSMLVTRQCYENLFHRKMHYLQWLASYQCASILLTGAGKVGSENGHSYVPYNISARADFFEILAGPQTTIERPICNTRDESLADDSTQARAHIIFFDSALCHTSMLLRAGVTQIVMAMIEQGQVPMCLLDDPVAAVHIWSRDPDLNARAAMAGGGSYTALELLEAIFEHAQRFVAAGRADGLVPRATDIMATWGECLQEFKRRDMDALATKIDWVAKRFLLRRAAERRNVAWESPLIKYLDQLYASLDPAEGLYYALERAGAVKRIVTDADIERAVNQPSNDTRAWLRSEILKRAEPGTIDHVNWDTLRLRTERVNRNGWTDYTYQTIPMKNPLAFTRQECAAVLDAAPTLGEAVAQLIAMQAPVAPSFVLSDSRMPIPVPPERGTEDSSTPFIQGD